MSNWKLTAILSVAMIATFGTNQVHADVYGGWYGYAPAYVTYPMVRGSVCRSGQCSQAIYYLPAPVARGSLTCPSGSCTANSPCYVMGRCQSGTCGTNCPNGQCTSKPCTNGMCTKGQCVNGQCTSGWNCAPVSSGYRGVPLNSSTLISKPSKPSPPAALRPASPSTASGNVNHALFEQSNSKLESPFYD